LLRVALTGGIASGKSYVLARIASHGVPTIDADALVHEALAAGSPAVPRVAARFGRVVLAHDGSVDRKALGRVVFADAQARADLESILHPDVFRRIDRWFASLTPGAGESDAAGSPPAPAPQPARPAAFAVADIPLLFETRHEGLFDRVIVASCSPVRQMERMMERDGLTREEARARLRAQWPIEDKARRAHYVIETSGAFEETDRQVDHVLAELTEDARRTRT
jgi:dephospho-CoA kinase